MLQNAARTPSVCACFVGALLEHVLCMKRMVSQVAENKNMCTVMLHKCRAGYNEVT